MEKILEKSGKSQGILSVRKSGNPVVDPRGAPPACSPHPTDRNFLNFMQFLGKFVCWHLPLEGRRPLLQRILDPPLRTVEFFTKQAKLTTLASDVIIFT